MTDTDSHIIDQQATLLDALRKLNALSGKVMTLFVTDGLGRVKGSLTDGDIRRALISGASTVSLVSEVMHRDFKSLSDKDIDVARLREYRSNGITLLPVLGNDGILRSIIDLSMTRTLLPVSAILMAGGKGERLRPLTNDTPKPLLEICGKAIIDYNVEALAASGITDITVTTRYLAEKIHAHFSNTVAGVNVKCVTEDMPMGTIGSASLVDLPLSGNTIVMNSDLLTTISFEEMYLLHMSEHAHVTIAAIPYQVAVPYAILSIDEADPASVTGIEEKPAYSHYANAGIYIFDNSLLSALPRNRRTDATDLIGQAIADGKRVVYYPINGTWIDVGSPTDFRQAEELMRHHRDLANGRLQPDSK